MKSKLALSDGKLIQVFEDDESSTKVYFELERNHITLKGNTSGSDRYAYQYEYDSSGSLKYMWKNYRHGNKHGSFDYGIGVWENEYKVDDGCFVPFANQ